MAPGAKGMSAKSKLLAAGAVVCLGGAAIAIGVVFGLKAKNNSSDTSGNLKGSTVGSTDGTAAATQQESCGLLEMYSSTNNPLDGTFSGFAYGPVSNTCCTGEYKCPHAVVTTYRCNGGDDIIYEMQCCSDMPTDKDFSMCTGDIYHTTVSNTSNSRRLAAADMVCDSTGMETVQHCSARPTSKGLTTTKVASRIVAATDAPETPAPTPEPTPVPTAVPTAAPTKAVSPWEPTPDQIWVVPDNEICKQPIPPPGVKVNSCLQVMCRPKGVTKGGVFHTTVRWCLQRPRQHHITINLLDMKTKKYYIGTGYETDKAGPGYQCGEHTFVMPFDAEMSTYYTPPQWDIMWKWFVTPFWGNVADGTYQHDPFPNMLAESGIDKQPTYDGLVEDCVPVEDRFWNLPPTGKQDAIDFHVKPKCFQPGQPWQIEIKTHLESMQFADMHVNLQLGTGGDKYLGTEDVFKADSPQWKLEWNAKDKYWTYNYVYFGPEKTSLINNGDLVYVSAFLVPWGDTFEKAPPAKNHWDIREIEYYLQMEFC